MCAKIGLALGTAEALEAVESAVDAACIYCRPIQAAEKFSERVALIIIGLTLIQLCRYGATRSWVFCQGYSNIAYLTTLM